MKRAKGMTFAEMAETDRLAESHGAGVRQPPR